MTKKPRRQARQRQMREMFKAIEESKPIYAALLASHMGMTFAQAVEMFMDQRGKL